MSGDWIRMRVSLADHPRTRKAAEVLLDDPRLSVWAPLRDIPDRDVALRVTRYVCVTAMLKFWGYANEHAKGDRIDFIVTRDVDEITGVPGFGDALAAAGWVIAEPGGGLRLPDFSSHNTSAEVRKSSAAERQKAYRDRKKLRDASGDITRDVTSHAREEKRREDIPPSPRKRGTVTQAVSPIELIAEGFSQAVADEFIAHKAAKKAPLTARAWQLHLSEAKKAGWSPVKAAEHVMAKGWKGFEAAYVERNGVTPQGVTTGDIFAGAR